TPQATAPAPRAGSTPVRPRPAAASRRARSTPCRRAARCGRQARPRRRRAGQQSSGRTSAAIAMHDDPGQAAGGWAPVVSFRVIVRRRPQVSAIDGTTARPPDSSADVLKARSRKNSPRAASRPAKLQVRSIKDPVMYPNLLSPVQMGALTLPNRVLMAPLTRSRAGQPGDVPTAMNAEYYAQRAGAGLIVSEATQ